ncbi:hypothetical protein [Nocardia terpenica]|uniref:hypothetical protein n=1 Tax=Nocardia terpenica TaxID=455432 RepID=UPI0012E77198|nr:hypothetical protein [Nocardia terpenica]NQE90885.1 hypothetical protein [Nocardia terpenica]
MVDKKTSAISARRQARERLARERAEQAERNKLNEADLVDYLLLEQKAEAVDSEREAAITAANDRHRAALADLKKRQTECLSRMSRRGETASAIASRTGLTLRQVNSLVAATPGTTGRGRRRKPCPSIVVDAPNYAPNSVSVADARTGDGVSGTDSAV